MESKITCFGSVFEEKLRNKIKVEKLIAKKEKTLKVLKIQLIYCLKLKYNATRRKIKKKPYNLTQNCAQNDPIHIRIKTFHYTFQKIKILPILPILSMKS